LPDSPWCVPGTSQFRISISGTRCLPCESAMLFESVMLQLAVFVSGLITVEPSPCATETEETTIQYNSDTWYYINVQTFNFFCHLYFSTSTPICLW
jgi:hypothetical protein